MDGIAHSHALGISRVCSETVSFQELVVISPASNPAPAWS